MKIKIAVTDANIFIDLYDLEIINSFFDLDIEVHTTSTVLYELYLNQQQILLAYHSVGKLEIHNLKMEDYEEIFNENYPKSLSEADKSVLHVANKINAYVLSSDKAVRNFARIKNIKYHGMIWVFDKLVENKVLSGNEAKLKLKKLLETNFIYRNNQTLVEEIEKRLNTWI